MKQRRGETFLRLGVVFCFLGLLTACSLVKTQSKEEALKSVEWQYAQEGIELNLTSEPTLNWWGDQPHTLLVSVLQLEELSVLEKYKSNQQALSELLLAETAPAGFLSLNRFFLAPDSQLNKKIARVDKSRYVAIFLGYQHLDPQRSMRVYQIGTQFDRKGWVFREYKANPEAILVQLHLGADGVMLSKKNTQSPTKITAPQSGWVNMTKE